VYMCVVNVYRYCVINRNLIAGKHLFFGDLCCHGDVHVHAHTTGQHITALFSARTEPQPVPLPGSPLEVVLLR
jgi:hypothetical protein